MKEFLKKDKNRKIIFIILFVAFFTSVYMLNYFTPLVADDYDYAFIFNDTLENSTQRVDSVQDIIVSMQNHYHSMNGRLVIHFFVQLMIMIGKPLFNIINTLMYMALGFVVHFIVIGYRKFNFSVFFCVEFLLFVFNEAWGQTCIWLTGSCNYLWSSVIAFTYIMFFRFYLDNENFMPKVLIYILSPVMGFLSGWSNENLSTAVIVFVFLFLLYCRYSERKIPAWGILGLIANIFGLLPMALSPAKPIGGSGGIISKLVFIIKNIPQLVYNMILPNLPFVLIIIFFIIAFSLKFKLKDKETFLLIGFGCFAVVSVFICLLSSYTKYRNGIFASIALIICTLILFEKINKKDYKRMITALFICMAILLPIEVGNAEFNAVRYYSLCQKRTEIINEAVENGEDSVTLEAYIGRDKHIPVGQSDINAPWPASSMAKYYGLKEIKSGY